MKKIIALSALAAVVLSGCISTRSTINSGLDVLAGDHYTATDNEERFSLELPQGFELFEIDRNEQNGGRLLGVRPEGGAREDSLMLIEETTVPAQEVIDELAKTGPIKKESQYTEQLGAYEGTIMDASIIATGNTTQYVFIRPSNRTYIFSLANSEPWGYFTSITKNFTHLKDAPAVAPPSTSREELPEIQLGGIEIN